MEDAHQSSLAGGACSQSTSSSRPSRMTYVSKKLPARFAGVLDAAFGVEDAFEEFGNGCVLPALHHHIAQQIIDAEVREDDVWVVSYPKTGEWRWVEGLLE